MQTLKVLEPIQLGTRFCRNRILMAAHSYGYADQEGLPTQFLVDYLTERAKGGIGLVIMGGTAVSAEGALPVGQITRSLSDRIIPWYEKIAMSVHEHGALVFDQLMHAGGLLRAREGVRILAPSPIPHERTRGIPAELTIQEIKRIIADFETAAARVRAGGLDGLELKCDQGFLIQQFLSPYYNRRFDEYGGSYENRLRFLFEIIDRVRAAVGKNCIVGLRITGDSLFPGDLTIDDSVKIVQDIAATGQIDYFHVNGATNSSFLGYLISHGDSSIEPMNFAPFAKRIKKAVSVPVMAASMVVHPLDAERLILDGAADMVAMTRAHIADPEIVNKLRDGRADEIRPCILINQGCVGNHYVGYGVRCIHNAATGREGELGIGTIQPASRLKHIAVIGGGIAGLQVARVCALRGHTVDLFEKMNSLGGQILIASRVPYRQGLLDIIKHLEHQLKKLQVNIHLGVEVDSVGAKEMLEEYDALVVATGAEPFIPSTYEDIDTSECLTVQDVLRERRDLGKNVLVLDVDWRQNSLGIAEFLLQRGHNVTLVSTAFLVGDGLDIVSLSSYYSRLQNRVRFVTLTDLLSFRNSVVRLRNVLSNEIEEVSPINQVVFVTGARPVNDLLGLKMDTPDRIFSVGDCLYPLGIPEAVLDAERLARTL